jgi:hypothetical protein
MKDQMIDANDLICTVGNAKELVRGFEVGTFHEGIGGNFHCVPEDQSDGNLCPTLL